MDEKLSKQLNIAISAVFIIAAGVLVWSAMNRQGNDAPVEEEAVETSSESMMEGETTPEYAMANDLASLTLASDFESWTPDAKLEPAKTRSVTVSVTGDVAKAFLVVRAAEGENALTQWDSYYFKINNSGGHLFRPMSLSAPSEENTTVLLYDLTDVPYLSSVPYSEDREPEHVNLLELLVPNRNVVVTTFISSLRPSTIKEASIRYQCAEGSDCSLELK